MDLVVSSKNYKELNKIRKHLIEDYLDTSIDFSSYRVIGTDTQKITIDTEDIITNKEKENIINLFKKLNYNHRFLYHGFELPVKQLKSLNDKYKYILNCKKCYFYDPSLLTEELSDFAHIFVNHFKFDFISLSANQNEIKNNIGLKSLGIVPCKIENTNGRLYVSYDGEDHHMEHDNLSKFLYFKMESSDLEICYELENNIDKTNALKISKGISPISYFNNGEFTSYNKFRLLVSFAKICNKNNLPMLNPKDINKFINNIYGFEYYSLKLGRMIEEHYKEFELPDYKEHEFDNKEHALSFSIYLSGFGIKHYIMKDQIIKTFTVCYIYCELLDPYPDQRDMKKRFLMYLYSQTGHGKDQIDFLHFKYMELSELFKSVVLRNTVILDRYNVKHINPVDNEPIPIEYFDIKGQQSNGIYNIGNVIKGIYTHIPKFNRENLSVRDVPIRVNNGKVIVNNIVLKRNMLFQDEDLATYYICKIWKKGYFLNSYGLNYYLETGEISTVSIESPERFCLENSSEKKFYDFLSFNDL
jgi:hypothetical protein